MDDVSLLGATMMAMRYGHRPLFENAVERLDSVGVPTEGMQKSFDDVWGDADTSAEAALRRVRRAARAARTAQAETRTTRVETDPVEDSAPE